MAENKTRTAFVEPRLLLRTESLPEGKAWLYELKFDGYRALAIKSAGELYLRSRNGNDFSVRYPGIVNGLSSLPDDTVVDGEVVALDTHGKPSFNMLQNYGSAGTPLHFYVFNLLVLSGKNSDAKPTTSRASQWLRPRLEAFVLVLSLWQLIAGAGRR